MALSQHPNDTTLQAKYDHALARLSTFDLRPATILAIVHDRSFIERFATDVWAAKDGKISR